MCIDIFKENSMFGTHKFKSIFSILLVSLVYFVFASNTYAATVTYDFESDTVGAQPANTTVDSGTTTVKSVPATLPTNTMGSVTCTTNPCNLLLTAFPSQSDYSVVWKGAGSANTYRNGFILRAQPTPYSGFSAGSNTRKGYLFQSSISNGSLRMYRFDTA